ncbi:MAG: hypothetical protein ACI4XC_01240 [Eubacterium sp.]
MKNSENSVKISNRKKNSQILDMLFVAAFAFALLLIFSFSTSPIYNNFGYDSLEYKLAGSAILDGLVMFRDIFHQKGALFLFVEAVGEALCRLFNNENTGTLVIQWFNMSASLFLVLNISKKYVKQAGDIVFSKAAFFPYLITFAVSAFWFATLAYGNQVEEYSVLYQIIAVYITVTYCLRLNKGESKFSPINGFILGICLAVTFWFKPTTTVVICGCILFAGIELLVRKEFSCIFKNIGTGILGIAIITIPIFIYYWKNNALSDMLEQCFLFNYQYVGSNKEIVDTFQEKVLYLVTVILFPIATFVISCINRFKPISLLSLCMSCVNAVLFYITSVSYMFYAQVQVVCILVLMLSLLSTGKINKSLICIALILVTAMSVMFCGADKYMKMNTSLKAFTEIQQNAERFNDFYPEAEKYLDDGDNKNMLVLTDWYEENRYIYYHMREYPYSKLFAVDFFEKMDAEKYIEDFNSGLKSDPPKFIVISKEFGPDCESYCDSYDNVLKMLDTKYTKVCYDDNYTMYELNQN